MYFDEESGALDVGAKAREADDKARGKKKDVASFFQSTKALRKKAGNLSVKQEELDIKSTGARNDYILSLASANAHQEQYFKHDQKSLKATAIPWLPHTSFSREPSPCGSSTLRVVLLQFWNGVQDLQSTPTCKLNNCRVHMSSANSVWFSGLEISPSGR